MPLGSPARRLGELPKERPMVAYRGHGERSATALSVLERAGFAGPLINLDGGDGAWEVAGHPTERFAAQFDDQPFEARTGH